MIRPYYRVRVQIGPRVWDVKSTDPAAAGPVLPLSFGWAVPDTSLGFPAQPDPASASLGIAALTPADAEGIDIGSPVSISVWLHDPATAPPADLAATGIIASFAGRVAAMRARPNPPHGTLYQITAVDYTVDLSSYLVGGSAWPAETAEVRSDRILTEAGFVPPAGLAPDPGGTVSARAAGTATARDILLQTLSHGVTADKARYILTTDVNTETGTPDVVPYSYRAVRRAVYAIDVLDSCTVNADAEWTRNRRSAADWVFINHPGGPTIYGTRTGNPLPPITTDQTNPVNLAAFVLDNVTGYAWDGGTLRLLLHLPEAAPYLGAVSAWFDYGLGRAVVIPNIPAPQSPGGHTRYSGMIAAARFTIPANGRYVVDFRLRADVPNDSYVTTRWVDLAPALTWTTIDPAITWAQYEPGNPAGGQGTLTVRWDDVPIGTTWTTIDPALTWFDHRTIPKP